MHTMVRAGDTLTTIAERCYGTGRHWTYLYEENPLVQAGVLYEGQRIEVPALPAALLAGEVEHRLAQPLSHLPVRIRFPRHQPLYRHDGMGVFGVSGLVGELLLHRHGHVALDEFTPSKLLAYRMEQLAWARNLFVEHFTMPPGVSGQSAGASNPTHVLQQPYFREGWGYTLAGQFGSWDMINSYGNSADAWYNMRTSWATHPHELFEAATLLLGDIPAALQPRSGSGVSLGAVLRAACPEVIPPSALWVLTRDETYLQPALPMPTSTSARPRLLTNQAVATTGTRQARTMKKPSATKPTTKPAVKKKATASTPAPAKKPGSKKNDQP